MSSASIRRSIRPSAAASASASPFPPTWRAKWSAQLRQFGVARRGWIGVRIQQVTREIAEGLGLPTTQGALVADVTDGRPGGQGGLAAMAIWSPASTASRCATTARLPRIVADTPIGKTVNIDVLRKGRKQTLQITVQKLADDAKPDKPGKAPPPPPARTSPSCRSWACRWARWMRAARAKFKIGGQCAGRGGDGGRGRQPRGGKESPPRRCDRGSAGPGGEDAGRCGQARSMPTPRRARRSSCCWSTATAI